jgi:hypothetical protein
MITNSIQYRWLLAVGILAVAIVGGDALGARGGGGGGFRGGGGGGYSGGGGGSARPSFSNSGSIRYSAPRQTPSQQISRPAAPVTRPETPSTPAARPTPPAAVQRPAISQPVTPSYKPSNYGSIANSGGRGDIQHGSITTPGGTTISGIKGPDGGGAVSIKGADGGKAAGIKGSGGGGAGAVVGPGGGKAAGIKGPGGGAAGVVVGPGGGGAAGIRGPGGAGAGAIWTPRGYGAAGFRGPNGYGVAGIRGPYGSAVVTNLPPHVLPYPWHGRDYWYVSFSWYGQYWRGDDVYYAWVYPPSGFYYPSLPESYTTVVINNTTYYCSDDVYYREGEKDGQKGYVVAEAPEGAAAEQGENPFNILKSACDYVAGLEKFTAIVSTTTDEVLESGEKIQASSRRTLYVSRPDKVAVDALTDGGEKRSVYDGKTVSMFDRAKDVYAVVPMPPTIDATLDTLAQNYGIAMPLGDLLYKDAYDRLVARVATGQYVGMHKVGSVDCHHLAFSGDTVDWEVWIEAGEKPVLRKVTVDYKQVTAKPRFSALIVAWMESPASLGDVFEFKPPAGAKQIEVLPVRAGAAPAAKPAT